MLRFDPFRDVDRLVEQVLGAPAGSARVPRPMPMDLYRSGDHFVVHADLPGVDPGSVDVSVDGGTLTIRAERTGRTEETVDWIASERFTGTFMRQLSLGDGVNSDQISATYHNGVLTVSIPLAQRAKPRRIPLSVPADETVIKAPADETAIPASTQNNQMSSGDAG